jgi:hypothetical protein
MLASSSRSGCTTPIDEHAALRLELLRYLIDLGASADDLIVHRDTLPGLAAALAIRGGPLPTVEEVGQRSGLTVDEVRRLVRAAGFSDPQPGAIPSVWASRGQTWRPQRIEPLAGSWVFPARRATAPWLADPHTGVWRTRPIWRWRSV